MLHRIRSVAVTAVFVVAGVAVALANGLTVAPATPVSGPSPFAAGCEGRPQPASSVNFLNAEVEPRVAVNPTDPKNIVGVWQQDRWSDGGSHGVVAGVTHDGGKTWNVTYPTFSVCAGGTAANGGDYERASDPWVTFSPNGDVYFMALTVDASSGFEAPSAMLVSKSTDGGDTWSAPVTLRRDPDANVLNDKNSITADPRDHNFVYAIWDRLEFPSVQAAAIAGEHAIGYRGPTWFSRTTDGGNTWEAARMIFDPGEVNQTIGNAIVVLPNGDLVDGFNLIYNFKDTHQVRGENVAVLRSVDKGLTWSGPILIDKLLSIGVTDPRDGHAVRTEDDIPDITVDRNSGTLYAVWQDARFSGFQHDSIAFSKSTDGGLTWSTAVQINKTPTGIPNGNQQAFTPTIAVAANGSIAVTYYDFRNAPSDFATLATDYWMIQSIDGGTTWSEGHVAGAFDMRTAPVARGFFLGDYQGLATIGNTFVPLFVRTNSGNTTNRTDVFFTKAR